MITLTVHQGKKDTTKKRKRERKTRISREREREPQDSNTIRPNQIMRKQKDNYLTHWKELTKKLSKLEGYLALNREYRVEE